MSRAKTVGKRGRYVIAVTSCRPWSIVAGYLADDGADGVVELTNARMVCYFSSDARTVYGLAAVGPGARGRVSPQVGRVRVRCVEHLLDASEVARAAIEAGPWT